MVVLRFFYHTFPPVSPTAPVPSMRRPRLSRPTWWLPLRANAFRRPLLGHGMLSSNLRSSAPPDAPCFEPGERCHESGHPPGRRCYPPAGVKDLIQEGGHALLWSRSAREVQQFL